MDPITLLALVIGCMVGAAATQAKLWWRAHEVRSAAAALQRRKETFEARRVAWERLESRRVLARA